MYECLASIFARFYYLAYMLLVFISLIPIPFSSSQRALRPSVRARCVAGAAAGGREYGELDRRGRYSLLQQGSQYSVVRISTLLTRNNC